MFTRDLYGPIAHTLMFRWYRLEHAYAEETQCMLSTKIMYAVPLPAWNVSTDTLPQGCRETPASGARQ